MTYARIDGIDRPLSQLVMGVDSQPSDAHAAVLFDDFFERGGTTFDTAWMYGPQHCCGDDCENRIGRWIQARGVRDEVVIVNKGAHSPYRFPGVVRPQLLESLSRLRTDRVEVYLLHRDNPDVSVGEFVDALNQVRDEGLVRVFGASNWTRARFAGRAAPSQRDPESFAHGTASETSSAWTVSRASRRSAGCPPATIAMAYVLHQPFPTFALIGPRTLAELRQSLAALDVEITDDDVAYLVGEAGDRMARA